jgi:hypothetical protein
VELTTDWKTFHSFFYPKAQRGLSGVLTNAATPTVQSGSSLRSSAFLAAPPALTSATSPIHLVVEGPLVVSAHAEEEDLGDWLGAPIDEVIQAFSHRKVLLYPAIQVQKWLSESLQSPHTYDQIQFLRREAAPQLPPLLSKRKSAPRASSSKKPPIHFLLAALESRWRKLLPSTYGIYLQLQSGLNPEPRSLLCIVRRGRLEAFQVPDLSHLLPERRKVPQDVVRALSEHYLMPVQGLFLSASDWATCSHSATPWRSLFQALRSKRATLSPFRWSLYGVLALKAARGQ